MPDRLLDEILQAAERAGVAHRFDGREHVLFATRKQLIDFASACAQPTAKPAPTPALIDIMDIGREAMRFQYDVQATAFAEGVRWAEKKLNAEAKS